MIWMLLAGSRPVSMWLQMGPGPSIDQNLEGNPLDRLVFTGLVAIGLMVLARRGDKISTLSLMNWPILVFLCYCLVSVLWSDYPGVAFKRWIKALGDLTMVMIVLTDPDRLAAVKRFFARVGFILMPVSILLIKYYPDLGMRYNSADGGRGFIGVAGDKNMLGAICLFSGLGAVWRIVHGVRVKQQSPSRLPVIAHAVILAMAIWLLWNANSMTSIGCLTFGSGLIVATSFRFLGKRRVLVHAVAVMAITAACVPLFLDAAGGVLSAVGRDPTLTQRTELWGDVVVLNPNAVVGAGFESFWLGRRLDKLWAKYQWHPNESHNGYLEVFLNLGWVGLALLAVVLVTGYRKALDMLRSDPELGRLKLACLVAGVIYALTEAGFRIMHPMWISTMLAAIALPASLVPRISTSKDTVAEGQGWAGPARRPNAYAFGLPRPVAKTKLSREKAPYRF